MTIKISAFPNASLPMGSDDLVTGLQGGVNANFSQYQILTGQNGTSGSPEGARLTVYGGYGWSGGTGKGGEVYIRGGYGYGGSGNDGGRVGYGGDLRLYGGSSHSANGGSIRLNTGEGQYSGHMYLTTGNSHLALYADASTFTGGVSLEGGNGGGLKGGGGVYLQGGLGIGTAVQGDGAAGPIYAYAGATNGPFGGRVLITAGGSDFISGGSPPTGVGGNVQITGGSGQNDSGGGNVVIKGGRAIDAQPGGDIDLTGGTSGSAVGGNVKLAVGVGTSNGNIILTGLPTSAAGLPSGALWNSSGVVHIV